MTKLGVILILFLGTTVTAVPIQNCISTESCDPQCLIGYKFNDEGCPTCECTDMVDDMKFDEISGALYNYLKTGVTVPQQSDGEVIAYGGYTGSNLWKTYPDGNGNWIIPYVVNPEFTTEFKHLISGAIFAYETIACLRFITRTTQTNYLDFDEQDDGCYSYAGRRSPGNPNTINLASRCNSIGIVLHEIMHALAFYHEHQRPDRGDHVNILTQNIIPDRVSNFDIMSYWEGYGSPYDFESIMHYQDTAFSKNNQKTIVKLDGSGFTAQRTRLAASDIYQIRAMYTCDTPTTPPLTTSAPPPSTTTTPTPSSTTAPPTTTPPIPTTPPPTTTPPITTPPITTTTPPSPLPPTTTTIPTTTKKISPRKTKKACRCRHTHGVRKGRVRH